MRSEFIHGCIYEARPDVLAICHHHARAVMPFCISGIALQPVDHLGATMGGKVPFWDQHDEFGDTNLIVARSEEGRSLARSLGPYWVVLMRCHGATVAGTSVEETVFRSIFFLPQCQDAARGPIARWHQPVDRGRNREAGAFNLEPRAVARAWEYWTRRLRTPVAL
jgi:HCOMODA/2-hydroxy-3-carboxy-muconic semialdehyde decarboxylase